MKNIYILLIIAFMAFAVYAPHHGGGLVGNVEVSGIEGRLVMAHEARTFKPCGETEEYFVLGDSEAYETLKAEYEKEIANVEDPYMPIFAKVEGVLTKPPSDGFGADFEKGIRISKLVESSLVGSCGKSLIEVDTPTKGGEIKSPVFIEGKAKGYWFFEATAPVSIVDAEGLIVGEGYIQAEGEWMTEDFVPFRGLINYEIPADRPNSGSTDGTVILRNHNASGLPQNEEYFEIPIKFAN